VKQTEESKAGISGLWPDSDFQLISRVAVDYRFEDRKRVRELRGEVGVVITVLVSSFKKSKYIIIKKT
jgi:hypothetical protein